MTNRFARREVRVVLGILLLAVGIPTLAASAPAASAAPSPAPPPDLAVAPHGGTVPTGGTLLWPLEFDDGLAASFGELRGDRLHTGVDLRTRGETGFPVHVAAAGAVVRMKEEWRGYGLSVYVAHEGGLVTVYAHLDHVAPDLEERLARARATRGSRFAGDVEVSPGRPVGRGEVVAWTGESGAGLPHLHFETRRGMDRAVDPFAAGLAPPRDELTPVAESLVLEPDDPSARVNGGSTPVVIPLEGSRGRYRALERPVVSGPVRLALRAYDRAGAENWTGLGSLRATIDGRELYRLRFDAIPFSDAFTAGAVLDLARCHGGPAWYTYRLTPLPGASVPFASTAASASAGSLRLEPGLHRLEVELGDVVTTIAPRAVATIEILARDAASASASAPAPGTRAAPLEVRVVPTAAAAIEAGAATVHVGAGDAWGPVAIHGEVQAPEALPVPAGLRALAAPVRFLPDGHPFRAPVEVRFAPQAANRNAARAGIYRYDPYDSSWGLEDMGTSARVRRLGTWALLEDTSAPVIDSISPANGTALASGRGVVVVRVHDLGSGIPERGVRVSLDAVELDALLDPDRGWARAPYEAAVGEHAFRVRVSDRAGNTTEGVTRVTVSRD